MPPGNEMPAGSTAKPRRWPVALLVAFLNAVAGAVLAMPVSDWAMQAHHVSSFEGERGYAVVFLFAPLGFFVGGVVGFVTALLLPGSGFVGYVKRQAVALAAIAAIVFAGGGWGYATADHPPLVEGKALALEIEVRVPAKGRAVEQLKTEDFSVALVVSSSDRSYSDMRWADAAAAGEFITVPAWAPLRSRNVVREITAGVKEENRQIFNVALPASPKIGEAWSEWTPPRARFDGTKPTPEDQYQVRYRVRFEEEYSPTPRPDWPQPEATPDAETTPETSE